MPKGDKKFANKIRCAIGKATINLDDLDGEIENIKTVLGSTLRNLEGKRPACQVIAWLFFELDDEIFVKEMLNKIGEETGAFKDGAGWSFKMSTPLGGAPEEGAI